MITLDLLPWMGEVINLTGDPKRGAGWYGHTTGLHTVAIRALNFQGRVMVEATVATEPTEADWYSVLPDDVQFTSGCGYIQYPHMTYIVHAPSAGETSTIGFNFTSNAVWVRALVVRDYLIPAIFTPVQIMPYGVIDYVRVSYS